jgi:hypothetical protein
MPPSHGWQTDLRTFRHGRSRRAPCGSRAKGTTLAVRASRRASSSLASCATTSKRPVLAASVRALAKAASTTSGLRSSGAGGGAKTSGDLASRWGALTAGSSPLAVTGGADVGTPLAPGRCSAGGCPTPDVDGQPVVVDELVDRAVLGSLRGVVAADRLVSEGGFSREMSALGPAVLIRQQATRLVQGACLGRHGLVHISEAAGARPVRIALARGRPRRADDSERAGALHRGLHARRAPFALSRRGRPDARGRVRERGAEGSTTGRWTLPSRCRGPEARERH